MLKQIVVLLFFFLLFSCKQNQELEDVQKDERTVKVNFFNASSFRVDVYRNFNPSSSESSILPIATIPSGSVVKVKMTASKNKTVGDVFYIRYYVQLADGLSSGIGKPLYVKAERDISNIPIVLEEGKSYTKDILQPQKGTLKFINGYIKVQNTGKKYFQVKNGNTYLNKLGTKEQNLASGSQGFYEFSIPPINKSINIESLRLHVTSDGKELNVPRFKMTRGKVYSFQCDGLQVIGPNIQDISY